MAEAVNRQIESDKIDNFIKDNIADEIYSVNCNVEDCYDSFDIISIDDIGYKVGYINIVEDSLAEVTLEITAEICVEYTERDEENSYYDKEEGRYLSICPDCGKPISRKNDGGNGFCIDCAGEH